MSVTRIAVMGAGLIGREHCALINAHPNADLAAISDIDENAAQFAGTHCVPHFDDFYRMLDTVTPDGVIIALPNDLHLDAGLACIARGIPCLIEKPIADTLQVAQRLVDVSAASGVPILVGHHRRHSPDVRQSKRLIDEDALGGLVAVNGVWLADKPNTYFAADWRRNSGGGPILINLIHEIDCLRFIVGEIDSISAFASNRVRGFDVEDTVSIAIKFENGVLGTFLISDAVASPYSWEVTSGQALYFPHRPGDCYIYGGRKASLSAPSMTLWRHGQESENWQDPIEPHVLEKDTSRAYENQLTHFLAVITKGEAPLISAEDARMTLAATLAVGQAAREERTVKVRETLG